MCKCDRLSQADACPVNYRRFLAIQQNILTICQLKFYFNELNKEYI